MSIAGVILLVAFLIGVATIIAWPFVQPPRDATNDDRPLSNVAQLQAQHEAVLVAVRDLDFDYQLGKLTQEDYMVQRESLIQRGVDILRQIDTYQSELIEDAVRIQRTARKGAKS